MTAYYVGQFAIEDLDYRSRKVFCASDTQLLNFLVHMYYAIMHVCFRTCGAIARKDPSCCVVLRDEATSRSVVFALAASLHTRVSEIDRESERGTEKEREIFVRRADERRCRSPPLRRLDDV